MINIFLDVETIPTQRTDVRSLLRHRAELAAEGDPPANMSNPDTIERWRQQQRDGIEAAYQKAWHDTGKEPGLGEICCVCWAVDDEDVQSIDVSDDDVLTERELLFGLRDEWRRINGQMRYEHVHFIGFCIQFDLRFLHHRSVVHNIRLPVYLPYNDAPWRDSHTDLRYEWWGARPRAGSKLVDLCLHLGIDVEDSIDGSEVWQAWQDGRHEDIEEHCRADVERVRQAWKLMSFK